MDNGPMLGFVVPPVRRAVLTWTNLRHVVNILNENATIKHITIRVKHHQDPSKLSIRQKLESRVSRVESSRCRHPIFRATLTRTKICRPRYFTADLFVTK
jgi:hypothetical protein